MRSVFIAGVILVLMGSVSMVIADGWQSLRHPLDLARTEPDCATVATLGFWWRLNFRIERAKCASYRLALLSGLICFAIVAASKLGRV